MNTNRVQFPTVRDYAKAVHGFTDETYDEYIEALRIVDDADAMKYAWTGVITPEMATRLAPHPTPKQIYLWLYHFRRGELHDADERMIHGAM